MTALAKASSNCKRQTHPLVWEGTPYRKPASVCRYKNIWSWAPGGGLAPRQTSPLTVGCSITVTLNCQCVSWGHEKLWECRQLIRTWVWKLRSLNFWEPLPGNNWWRHRSLYVCRSTVICRVCRSMKLSWLRVFKSYKCSIHPITNPNPVSIH
jgi:hypothetical protein